MKQDKTWLLLPMLAYSKYSDGAREFAFGWLNQTFFIKYQNKMKIRRKLEFFYVWFKHVFLKVKLPLRSIELVEKHFKATKSEKKLIEKLKKINSKH